VLLKVLVLAFRCLLAPASSRQTTPCGSDVIMFLEAAAESPAAAAAALSAPLSSGACSVDGAMGSTPLHEVAKIGGPYASGMVTMFVGAHGSVLAVDAFGATPLHIAAEQDALAAAAALCRAAELRGDLSNLLLVHNSRAMTALDIAVASESVATAKLLVQRGSLHSNTFPGSCPGPLMDAVLLGDMARLGQAVDALADPALLRNCSVPPMDRSRSLLHLAAAAADLSAPPAGAEVVRALLASGASASDSDSWGETPVATAVRTDQADVVVALLAAGAEVDSRDVRRSTPLHNAARAGAEDSARVLLSYGAEPDAVDDAGLTPLDYARQAGHDSVVVAIQQVSWGPDPFARPHSSDAAPPAPPALEQPSPQEDDGSSLGIILATAGVVGGALAALLVAYVLRARCWPSSTSAVAALPEELKFEVETPQKPRRSLEELPRVMPEMEPPGVISAGAKALTGSAATPPSRRGGGGSAEKRSTLASAAAGDAPEQPTVVLVPRKPRTSAGKGHSPPAARTLRSSSPRVRSYRGAPPQMLSHQAEQPVGAARGRSSPAHGPCRPPAREHLPAPPPDTTPPPGSRRARRAV